MILFPLIAATAVATMQTMPAPTPATTITLPVSEDGFRVGSDTVLTVTKKLGRPNETEANSDGTTTIRYASVHTHVKGATFIPIVGMFAGGAKGKSITKSFIFGTDGLLKSYSSGNFQTDCSAFGGCH